MPNEVDVTGKVNTFMQKNLIFMCETPDDETPYEFRNINDILVLTPEEVNKLEWPFRIKPIVCWGDVSTRQLGLHWFGKTFNNVVKENKYKQTRTLMLEGVSVVPAALTAKDAHRLYERSGIVVRRKLAHSQGRDVVFIRQEDGFSDVREEGYYFRPFIKFKNEYRFHVVNGSVVAAAHKVHEAPIVTEEERMVRSYGNGWTFVILGDRFINSWRWWDRLCTLSKSAVTALDYDFGAVDIGLTEAADGTMDKAYVIEVNSAPGLIKPHVGLYFNAFLNTGRNV